jgi:hypothetical protein
MPPARLPGLEIEIVHRRSPGGNAEQISINLRACSSGSSSTASTSKSSAAAFRQFRSASQRAGRRAPARRQPWRERHPLRTNTTSATNPAERYDARKRDPTSDASSSGVQWAISLTPSIEMSKLR